MNPVPLLQPDTTWPPELRLGGYVPFTSTDFPGFLSAVVFCQGCPWQCGYCQNPHLIPPTSKNDLPNLTWPEIISRLERRKGFLDAVVFSGGEPTMQPGLERALQETRELGFKIGLHTGGCYPSQLEKILPLLDWVGMDIKAPFADYARITGVPSSGEKALASTKMLLESGVACEFRTTVHPQIFTQDSLLLLAEELAAMGIAHYALQEFRPEGCVDDALNAYAGSAILSDDFCSRIGALFPNFTVRRA